MSERGLQIERRSVVAPFRWLVTGLALAILAAPAARAVASDTSVERASTPATSVEQAPPTIQRASLERAPSFSPYTRVVHAWSRQGNWLLSSTEASWPPPWPKWTASALLDGEERRALSAALQRATEEGVPVTCRLEGAPLRRGQALLRVGVDATDGSEQVACYSVEERLEEGRFSPALEALYAFAPPVDSVDRWTHPFWLKDESGVLRIELKGTADLEIGPLVVGRVNGVLTLRLPVGPYDVTLRPADGADPREERVVLHRDQVTVWRISVEASAMSDVPSWTQPPLPTP